MREYIGEDGMPVVEYELEDVPKMKSGELFWPCATDEAECYLITRQGGGRTYYRLSTEALRAWIVDEKERHKAEFSKREVAEFEKLKEDHLHRMSMSRDPQKGRSLEIAELERILNGTEAEGLTDQQIRLREAWMDNMKGLTYFGGEPREKLDARRRRLKGRMVVRHDGRAGSGQWRELSFIDEPLRNIYANAMAVQSYLQWLRDTPADTSTPSALIEGGTGAENEPNTIENHVWTALEPLKLKAFRNVGEFENAVSRLCGYFKGTTEANGSQIWIVKGNKINLAKALGRIYRKSENTKPLDWDYQKAVAEMFDCFNHEDLEEKGGKGFSSTRMFNYMTRGANEMN